MENEKTNANPKLNLAQLGAKLVLPTVAGLLMSAIVERGVDAVVSRRQNKTTETTES